ncbi:TPA: hypothetical protein ACXLSB_004608, partial [Salmonella enterica]
MSTHLSGAVCGQVTGDIDSVAAVSPPVQHRVCQRGVTIDLNAVSGKCGSCNRDTVTAVGDEVAGNRHPVPATCGKAFHYGSVI